MLNKRFEFLAILFGSIVLFLAGGLIWELVLHPLQVEHTISYGRLIKEDSIIWIDALAQVPIAFIITFIFSKYVASLSISKGAFIGALACSMFNLSANLMILSRWNIIDGFVIVTDFIGMALWGAMGGAAIAWILGFKKND